MSLFEELKRRHVFRAAGAYAVAGWVIAQVSDLVLENVGAPDWVMQVLLLVLGIGFVLAVAVSWAYEISPEGIRRERDLPRDGVTEHATAKRLDIITIVLLIVALGVGLADRLLPDRGASSPDAPPPAEGSPDLQAPEKSIAVLPFVPLSQSEDDDFFGRGIAEELLNALTQIAELKVAARTSGFSLADQDVDLRQMGEVLGVAHVLEGSVRRSGDRLRVTAQLIRTSDGFHLWSETYERGLADIFDIQDEIVEQLSRILQIRLGVGAGAGRAGRTRNAQAYELYLRALDLWWTREDVRNRAEAVQTFRRVTELDPEFADGWAAYGESIAFSDVTYAPHLTPAAIPGEVSGALGRALELDPDNARALAALVFWHSYRQIDIEAAQRYVARALDVAPNYGFTNYAAAQFYFLVGDEREALAALDRALLADPLNETLERTRFQFEAAFGRFDDESEFLDGVGGCTGSRCQPSDWQLAWFGFVAALHSGTLDQIEQMRDVFRDVYDALDRPPDTMRRTQEFMLAYARSVLDEAGEDVLQYWARVGSAPSDPVGAYVLDASILAQEGLTDDALDIMERLSVEGRFFASRGIVYVVWPGRFQVPEQVRSDPRYRAIWSSPELSQVERARRANGQLAGLPN
jgi:TolB-like protein